MRNPDLIKAAVAKIPGAKVLGVGEVKHFSENSKGLRVELPGYRYPITIDTATGTVSSDTYSGRWGNPELLDKLAQNYGVEAARAEAEQRRAQFATETLDDGSIKCTITIGGGLEAEGGSPYGGTGAPML
jgi:hypothetical protein